MNPEPDFTCPNCGNTMELLTADDAGSLMRVCPVCATLAWTGEDGRVETRQGQEITGEARRRLLESRKFISVEEATAKLRRSKKTGPPQ